MDSKTARIRALNDELRQNFAGGVAVMTPGIAALGAEAVTRIVKTVGVFDDFCHANYWTDEPIDDARRVHLLGYACHFFLLLNQ